MQKGFSTLTRSTVLFSGWDIGTYTGLVFAMLFCVGGSILIEIIQARLNRMSKARKSEKYASTQDLRPEFSSNLMSVKQKLCLTFSHIFRTFMAYCIMLMAMSYNAWIYTSVILGAGLGYFFFKHYRQEGTTTHVHLESREETLNKKLLRDDEHELSTV